MCPMAPGSGSFLIFRFFVYLFSSIKPLNSFMGQRRMAHLILIIGTYWIFYFNMAFYFVSTTRNILTIVKYIIRNFNLISSN